MKSAGLKRKTVQMTDVNAPLRNDADFLSYCVSDNSADNHLPNPLDESPFIELGFPMVSGWVIDAMHTVFAGAFGQRIKGIVDLRFEGQVGLDHKAEIESRLKLFQACKPCEFDRHVRSMVKSVNKYKFHELRQLLYFLIFPLFDGVLQDHDMLNLLRLQHAMLLLGGCSPNPVSSDNIEKARSELKTYVEELKNRKFPIRITLHEMIHIPDDVEEFECGVEWVAAWRFETFQGIGMV